MVALLSRLCTRLRLRVARALPDREEQARDFQIPTLVIHGRLQNDRPHAHRPHGRRGQKGCAVTSPSPKFLTAKTSGSSCSSPPCASDAPSKAVSSATSQHATPAEASRSKSGARSSRLKKGSSPVSGASPANSKPFRTAHSSS